MSLTCVAVPFPVGEFSAFFIVIGDSWLMSLTCTAVPFPVGEFFAFLL